MRGAATKQEGSKSSFIPICIEGKELGVCVGGGGGEGVEQVLTMLKGGGGDTNNFEVDLTQNT